MCERCHASVHRIEAPLCARCGAPTAWPVARCRECTGRRLAFVGARSAVAYDACVRGIVAAWKERGLRRIAGWAAELVTSAISVPEVDVVVAIPSDRDRRLKRGHHPAEALASELAARWELSCESLLARTRGTPPQRGLDLVARRRNVRGAFVATGHIPRSVLVVDDVYTTGATANAAASALRRGGARHVEVVTFARAIRIR